MPSTSNYTFINGQKKYLNLLATGYPSPTNKANVKTSYTFIDGQKKYFYKDKFRYNNYAADRIKSCILYADVFNGAFKVAYIQDNTIKTKTFDILPTGYESFSKSIGTNNIVINYRDSNNYSHIHLIKNILTDTSTVELNLNILPDHSITDHAQYEGVISTHGIYITESAVKTRTLNSSGSTYIYTYKYYKHFIDFSNLDSYKSIDILSDYDADIYKTTIMPDGMIIFEYKEPFRIMFDYKGTLSDYTLNLLKDNQDSYISYYIMSQNFLYGLKGKVVYALNILNNETAQHQLSITSGTVYIGDLVSYKLKNSCLYYGGSSSNTSYHILRGLDAPYTSGTTYRYYPPMIKTFFHNDYNTLVNFTTSYNPNSDGTYRVAYISPIDGSLISYSPHNLSSTSNVHSENTNAPGIIMVSETNNEWYGSLDMVNFTLL